MNRVTDLHGCFPCDYTENDEIKIILRDMMKKLESIETQKYKKQDVKLNGDAFLIF